MAKNLVIVESPAKAKTISKFLGTKYTVKASMGHVRDLPKSKMGIEVEKKYKPTYTVSPDKKKTIKDLKDKISDDTVLWIATDEDREGEAIGWHLLEALKVKDKKRVKRIVFHEITKDAITKAIESPRDIDDNLVDAQQARRVLDRLVGYELSPLLWKKIRYGLSAGRVQSVAVRLIVEREREIEAFKPEEYFEIDGVFKPKNGKKEDEFKASLSKIDDKKAEVKDKKTATKIVKDLRGADYNVKKIEEKEMKKNPAPPFITSTLQQEASRKLHFSVKKTMMIAQQLYEGIKMGSGHHGLITYMRTDSVNLAESALKKMKQVIDKEYGKEYSLETPRKYKGKKGAQEAHEAIRPVDVALKPEDVKQYLDKDQLKLYELIWKRAIACQMAQAVFDRTRVDIECKKSGKDLGYEFRATGQVMKFPGFIKVYKEGTDHPDEDDSGENMLPKLKEGQDLDNVSVESSQHFTKPPARYTEASLVKKLEAEGIGRPSTYAPTISTIINRGYIEKEQKQLKPTDVGEVVNDLLVEHFNNIVDYQFTARMEEDLDDIAEGKKEWEPIVDEFYKPFHKNIEKKEKELKKEDVVNEETDKVCDQCGKKMVIKLGRFGKFLSCSGYPDCKNAQPLEEKTKEEKELEKKLAGKKCDKCGEPMVIKRGRFGEFLGCSAYPDCKNIKPIVKLSGVKCPKCQSGQLVERRTRKGGKLFWGCNKFPKCKFATWDKPTDKKCKKCKGMLVEKKDKLVCVECKEEVAMKKK